MSEKEKDLEELEVIDDKPVEDHAEAVEEEKPVKEVEEPAEKPAVEKAKGDELDLFKFKSNPESGEDIEEEEEVEEIPAVPAAPVEKAETRIPDIEEEKEKPVRNTKLPILIILILAVLAAVFFLPVMREYVMTGLVPRFPTLIVCGFLSIAAIQSLFTGLTLQTIQKKNLQDFEMQLMRAKREKRDLLTKGT